MVLPASIEVEFLNLCPNYFGIVRKYLIRIHDFIEWETNNYNIHITQCFQKQKQLESGNETWSVNGYRIKIYHITRSTLWSIQFNFIVCPIWGLTKYCKNKELITLTLYKVRNYSPSLIFSMIFEEKLFSIYALLTNQKTIAWLSLMLEIWGNVCFVINFSCKSVTSEIL